MQTYGCRGTTTESTGSGCYGQCCFHALDYDVWLLIDYQHQTNKEKDAI